VIGPDGGEVVKVHQDASVHVASLAPGTEVVHPIGPGRGVYGYLIEGAASFIGEELATGDAVKVTDESQLAIHASQPSELILVDVPMQFEPAGIWKGRI
jgi:redox-sensitive bicupin YhaK (pirin superfamily)